MADKINAVWRRGQARPNRPADPPKKIRPLVCIIPPDPISMECQPIGQSVGLESFSCIINPVLSFQPNAPQGDSTMQTANGPGVGRGAVRGEDRIVSDRRENRA